MIYSQLIVPYILLQELNVLLIQVILVIVLNLDVHSILLVIVLVNVYGKVVLVLKDSVNTCLKQHARDIMVDNNVFGIMECA